MSLFTTERERRIYKEFMQDMDKVVRDFKRNEGINKEQSKVNFNRVVDSLI